MFAFYMNLYLLMPNTKVIFAPYKLAILLRSRKSQNKWLANITGSTVCQTRSSMFHSSWSVAGGRLIIERASGCAHAGKQQAGRLMYLDT
jgi:hypothetical protein